MRTIENTAVTLLLAGSLFASKGASAQAPEQRFPLAKEAVATALQEAGLKVAASSVELPLALTAASESPTLQVSKAELLANGHLRIRLGCRSSQECLPFFAMVTPPAEGIALTEIARLDATLHAGMPFQRTNAPALRAGSPTTLLMGDDHMRIAMPVISLDSGALGAEVRVSTADRKRVFRAVVVSPQVVRGDLP